MPQRKCTKTKTKVTRPHKRITLPIDMEKYREIVDNVQTYRQWLDEMIVQYPELFPHSICEGYTLHDARASEKLEGLRLRRICLQGCDAQGKKQVFTIAPSPVLPYCVGWTDEVEKALFLRRFDVPFWALTYLFGHNDPYWYRLENQFGRYNLVQTVVKDPAKLPKHLLADEKITWLNGEEVVVATTVGEDCVLGASVALGSDTPHLEAAYQHFKDEAQHLDPAYQPETVNTDGWEATQKAWRSLFPLIVILECFLHAFIKIRQRGKHLKDLFSQLSQKVWEVYHAGDAVAFRLQAIQLLAWAETNTSGAVLEAVRKLCAKVDRFVLAYAHPHAHRTSNMLDRHMNAMARWLDSTRFFHGHWVSAERSMRAWALLHDFGPYCPRAKISQTYSSPFHKLNGFVYHANWLHNLLISTSLSGCTT
ncbi:MAG: hypothetical protein L0287_09350 [Anaerolineae bacterium]|nr:hypothetical protein [Anaerolineae bacterium]